MQQCFSRCTQEQSDLISTQTTLMSLLEGFFPLQSHVYMQRFISSRICVVYFALYSQLVVETHIFYGKGGTLQNMGTLPMLGSVRKLNCSLKRHSCLLFVYMISQSIFVLSGKCKQKCVFSEIVSAGS